MKRLKRMIAIIPACEGGTTLPNKNIRIVNGKPMIYYVIQTAKASRYISEILVTTNSPEIMHIARRMGVQVLQRDESLCCNSVSVDAVIYNAVSSLPKDQYDDVVTLQSISPTLRVKTLDAAIEKYIQSGCDTMISVVNKPYFFWRCADSKPVPLQKQRGNRHNLPHLYQETGAFLITKMEHIAPENRIGPHVELYELSEEEGIAVSTFGDLKQVENILSRKRTAFYVNGNSEIGLGHISRVLQISDELFTKPDIYFDYNQTNRSVFGGTTHNICPVDGIRGFLNAVEARDYDVIINDILSTSVSYMQALKRAAPKSKIINFEDEGAGAFLADGVVNALYEHSNQKNVYVGSCYYIVPKQFLIYEPIQINETVENVIVTFGGADPNGYTDQVLRLAVKNEFHHIHFHVVLGRAKNNAEQLMRYSRYPNINILYNIDNMSEVMSRCDVAITSRGRTGFELAVLGIPAISIAQNKREEKHNFMCEENGFVYLGYRPTSETLETELVRFIGLSAQERTLRQERMLANDLRNGRSHVMDLIDSI